jgi:hypothetical protein
MSNDKAFFAWLKDGISDPFCSTHDQDPAMTDEEREEWEAGGDPCCPVVRLIEKEVTHD